MAGFLYFLPGADRAPGLDELDAAGLAYAFDRKPAARQVTAGPDRLAGWICADEGSVPIAQTGYYADRQTWRKIPGREAWIGRYQDVPIAPEDLARPEQLGGHLVTLADGREWLVPVARGAADEAGQLVWYNPLPHTSKLDDAGRWVRGDVVDRYRPLWELAVEWDNALASALAQTDDDAQDDDRVSLIIEFENVHPAAVRALAFNYRIGDCEADALGLLTEKLAAEVLGATVDLPTRLEIIKKKHTPPESGA